MAKKSANYHRLRGSLREDRRQKLTLHPSEPPPPPEGLCPAARKKWRQAAGLLAQLGILSVLDLDALRLYCAAWVQWLEASEVVRTKGQTYEAGGLVRRRPETVVAAAAAAQVERLADKLGLTPAGRLKLGIELPVEQEPDPFEELLNGREYRTSPDGVRSRVRHTGPPPPAREEEE